MTFDLERILVNKREYRKRLAARPIAEKLAMLDALRERTLALRGGGTDAMPTRGAIAEPSSDYGQLPLQAGSPTRRARWGHRAYIDPSP